MPGWVSRTKTRSAVILAGPGRSRQDPENKQNSKKTLGFKAIRFNFGVSSWAAAGPAVPEMFFFAPLVVFCTVSLFCTGAKKRFIFGRGGGGGAWGGPFSQKAQSGVTFTEDFTPFGPFGNPKWSISPNKT